MAKIGTFEEEWEVETMPSTAPVVEPAAPTPQTEPAVPA